MIDDLVQLFQIHVHTFAFHAPSNLPETYDEVASPASVSPDAFAQTSARDARGPAVVPITCQLAAR